MYAGIIKMAFAIFLYPPSVNMCTQTMHTQKYIRTKMSDAIDTSSVKEGTD